MQIATRALNFACIPCYDHFLIITTIRSPPFLSNEFSESEVTCVIGRALSEEELPFPRQPEAANLSPNDLMRGGRMRGGDLENDFSARDRMRSGERTIEQYPCVPSATYKCILNYDYEADYIWARHEVTGFFNKIIRFFLTLFREVNFQTSSFELKIYIYDSFDQLPPWRIVSAKTISR